MLRYINISYYVHDETVSLASAVTKYNAPYAYASRLKQYFDTEIIMHFQHTDTVKENGVTYTALRSSKFWHIPFRTHSYVKRKNPDVVVVEGFIYPLQVIFLRFALGRHCKMILQYHGEKPSRRWLKRILYKIANRFVDAFFFTSAGLTEEWIETGIIKSRADCIEITGASTILSAKDKKESVARTGMSGSDNFLWIGRLDRNKDPVTVLAAFEKYVSLRPSAKLYMVYQAEDLLPLIKSTIAGSPVLQGAIHLVGEVPNEELAWWYSAADYYISGSHSESTGFTLIEAMACGCVPVVTDIPSFRKITNDGEFGMLYEPGNADTLLQVLIQTGVTDHKLFSEKVRHRFQSALSPQAHADSIYRACMKIKQEAYF